MTEKKIFRIGTRGSVLALIQAEMVKNAFEDKFPDYEFEIVPFRTEGDRLINYDLKSFGGKGVFVQEIEEALQKGRIDFAVHSMKDMPMELGDGLNILSTLKREEPRDVLVSLKTDSNYFSSDSEFTRKYWERNANSRIIIGTGSPRRIFQLQELFSNRSNISFRSIRGNVPTRLSHIGKDVDAVVLAMAGLKRLGLSELEGYYYRLFTIKELVPAGGQGTIAIEGIDDELHHEMAGRINDENAFFESMIERKILRKLDAGCSSALGVKATIFNDNLCINVNFDGHSPSLQTVLGKASDKEKLIDEILSRYE